MSDMITYPMLVAEVERLKASQESYKRHMSRRIDVIAGVLHNVVEDTSCDCADVEAAIDRLMGYVSIDAAEVREILLENDAVPAGFLTKTFRIDITVPVRFSMHLDAIDADTAEEMAADELSCQSIEAYSLDWDTYEVEYEAVEEC